jgi:hypothetical protein
MYNMMFQSLTFQPYATASDSELLDDSKNKSATTDDEAVPNSSSTGRRRFSKFHLGKNQINFWPGCTKCIRLIEW